MGKTFALGRGSCKTHATPLPALLPTMGDVSRMKTASLCRAFTSSVFALQFTIKGQQLAVLTKLYSTILSFRFDPASLKGW